MFEKKIRRTGLDFLFSQPGASQSGSSRTLALKPAAGVVARYRATITLARRRTSTEIQSDITKFLKAESRRWLLR